MKNKPTIHELEKILDEAPERIYIKPDGSVDTTNKTEIGRCRDCISYFYDESLDEYECTDQNIREWIDSDGGFSFNPPNHFRCDHWEQKEKQ